jgi:hypothetical protein
VRDRRLFLASIIPAILWLACWPFVNSSVNDDFSYAFTVKRLLETGRFTYNGWSTAMLGVQAYWGALFAWCFGFSHDALRVSTLVLSIACGGLAYALHRRFGVGTSWSLFGSLLLTTSPLFTPWSASFMTDVPGVFFTLLLLHATISLNASRATRNYLAWTFAILVIGVAGGSVRQTICGMAIGLLLVESLLRRKQPFRSAVSFGAALLVAACFLAMLRWQAAQPYAIVDLWRPGWRVSNLLKSIGKLTLDAILFTLPLRFALTAHKVRLSSALPLWVGLVVSIAAAGCFLTDRRFAIDLFAAPWTGNTITRAGLTNEVLDAPGLRPIIFPDTICIPLGVVTWTAGLTLALRGVSFLISRRRSLRTALPRVLLRRLHLPFLAGCVYVAMLMPRASDADVFDRYLLVLFPMISVLALSFIQPPLPMRRLSWAVLGVMAAVGVAVTFDHFSELRARVALVNELVSRGVRRDQIIAGLNADLWTQIELRGFVNDARIIHPAGAFNAQRREPLKTFFWTGSLAPAIDPLWEVINVTDESSLPYRGIRRSFPALLAPQRRWIVAIPLEPAATTQISLPME